MGTYDFLFDNNDQLHFVIENKCSFDCSSMIIWMYKKVKMFICKQKCLLLVVCLTVCISTYFRAPKVLLTRGEGAGRGGMLPQKVLSLDFQDGLSLFFLANFVLNQHYM